MLKLGDTVEILEPEDKANYPYGWNSDMDRLVGTKPVVTRIHLDSQKRIRYNLTGNSKDWHESNLKLIRKATKISNIDVNEPVIITSGEHVGEMDTIESCHYQNGRIYYFLQSSNYVIRSDYVKPLNNTIELF